MRCGGRGWPLVLRPAPGCCPRSCCVRLARPPLRGGGVAPGSGGRWFRWPGLPAPAFLFWLTELSSGLPPAAPPAPAAPWGPPGERKADGG